MSTKEWVTPAEALRLMRVKLPLVEPLTLAIWGRNGELRAKAASFHIGDGIGYTDVSSETQTNPSHLSWGRFWNAATQIGSVSEKHHINWTAGEITVFDEVDQGVFDELSIKGLMVNRTDLLRCINAAKLGALKKHVDPAALERWLSKLIQEQGPDGLSERQITQAAKLRFPGERGASAQALNLLRRARKSAETKLKT